jgi:hypothetical protein
MLKLLRKGPVCAGIPADGSTCDARVDHPGARCLSCLEELSTSRDVEARLEAAGRAELPLELFQLLAGDPDDRVRLRIARHTECPLIVLQHLEADGDAAVRLAAAAALSTSLSPRVLRQPEQDEALFTRAEVEALGRTDHDGEGQSTASVVADRIRRVGGPGAIEPTAAMATVLARLDELGDRLSALEGALSSTGERLGAIAARLDELAGAGPDGAGAEPVAGRRNVGTGAGLPAVVTGAGLPVVGTGAGLLPVPRPAALGTGPVVRADVVAATWLAVIPLLARRRRAGMRVSPPSAPTELVAGPLLPPHPPIAGELTPASPVDGDAWVPTDPPPGTVVPLRPGSAATPTRRVRSG